MDPLAEETTTFFPLRSLMLFTGEFLRTTIPAWVPSLCSAPTALTRTPPASAWRVGRSAAYEVSAAPACTAWNSGAAPSNSAHFTLYGVPFRAPEASKSVFRFLAWSPRVSVTFDGSVSDAAWLSPAHALVARRVVSDSAAPSARATTVALRFPVFKRL